MRFVKKYFVDWVGLAVRGPFSNSPWLGSLLAFLVGTALGSLRFLACFREEMIFGVVTYAPILAILGVMAAAFKPVYRVVFVYNFSPWGIVPALYGVYAALIYCSRATGTSRRCLAAILVAHYGAVGAIYHFCLLPVEPPEGLWDWRLYVPLLLIAALYMFAQCMPCNWGHQSCRSGMTAGDQSGQFSLRTLLKIVLVVSVCLSCAKWVVMLVDRVNEEEAKLAPLRRLYCHPQYANGYVVALHVPSPDFGGGLQDQDFAYLKAFKRLERLAIAQSIRGHQLASLKDLPCLKQLDLSGCTFRDSDLKELKGLVHVRELLLAYTPVTDEGVEHLSNLVSLRVLSLERTAITDKGLMRLNRLAELDDLNLGETLIGDRGAACLGSLRRLTSLDLHNTKIGDGTLKILSRLGSLSALDLSGTRISDRGLAHLRQLKSLQKLSLKETLITDAGILQLRSLRTLVELNLYATLITDASLVSLEALPKLATLELSMTEITDRGVKSLNRTPSLRMVKLFGTHITEAGYRRLETEWIRPEEAWGVWERKWGPF